jgi:NAD(P)H dehydrogenase (quinone)
MGVLAWQMKRFWDETMFDHWGKVDGKVACAFSSSGGWGGGAEIACQSLQMVLMNFGFLVFGVTDYAGKVTTCHYGAVAARDPPDAEVKDACRLLGRRLAEWVADRPTARWFSLSVAGLCRLVAIPYRAKYQRTRINPKQC